MLYHVKAFIFLKTKVQFSFNFEITFDKVFNKLNKSTLNKVIYSSSNSDTALMLSTGKDQK